MCVPMEYNEFFRLIYKSIIFYRPHWRLALTDQNSVKFITLLGVVWEEEAKKEIKVLFCNTDNAQGNLYFPSCGDPNNYKGYNCFLKVYYWE